MNSIGLQVAHVVIHKKVGPVQTLVLHKVLRGGHESMPKVQ